MPGRFISSTARPAALISTLTGSHAGDHIGSGGVTALTNGNLRGESRNGTATAGAVTWGSGTAGVSGRSPPPTAWSAPPPATTWRQRRRDGPEQRQLRGGSPDWTNGAAANAGAVTWGSGTTGVSGPVSAANSLVGITAGDAVGGRRRDGPDQRQLRGRQPRLEQRRGDDAGAVTWGSGTTGVSGPVTAANSLVGSTANDKSAATA